MQANDTEDFDSCYDINCTHSCNEELEKETLLKIHFWLSGVTQCTIASIGLLGNILSIAVFSSKELRSTFHVLLVILAVLDLGYLILSLLEGPLVIYDITTQKEKYQGKEFVRNVVYLALYPKIIYPFKSIFFLASEYFTVVISVDQYYAIMPPL